METFKKLICLDRDDTLIRNIPYLSDPSKIDFFPGVIPGLEALQNAGYGLVIITNQSGISRKIFNLESYRLMENAVVNKLADSHVSILATYFCPHGPDEGCPCRKPRPGMLLQAIQDFGADPAQSWMIGNADSDVAAGEAAGLRSLQIDPQLVSNVPGRIYRDFSEAVAHILETDT